MLFMKVFALVSADYTVETMCYVKIRWHEHESGIDENPECFKHLQEHSSHFFSGQYYE